MCLHDCSSTFFTTDVAASCNTMGAFSTGCRLLWVPYRVVWFLLTAILGTESICNVGWFSIDLLFWKESVCGSLRSSLDRRYGFSSPLILILILIILLLIMIVLIISLFTLGSNYSTYASGASKCLKQIVQIKLTRVKNPNWPWCKPAGYLQAWPRIWTWDYHEQIQLAVRAGLQLEASKLQVHATSSIERLSILLLLLSISWMAEKLDCKLV